MTESTEMTHAYNRILDCTSSHVNGVRQLVETYVTCGLLSQNCVSKILIPWF